MPPSDRFRVYVTLPGVFSTGQYEATGENDRPGDSSYHHGNLRRALLDATMEFLVDGHDFRSKKECHGKTCSSEERSPRSRCGPSERILAVEIAKLYAQEAQKHRGAAQERRGKT